MSKIVVLSLNGTLQAGVRVFLEIREGETPRSSATGWLPPNPELAATVQAYWESYRRLGAPYAIAFARPRVLKPKSIENDGKVAPSSEMLARQLREQLNVWLSPSQTFSDISSQLSQYLYSETEIHLSIRTDDFSLRKLPWHEWQVWQDNCPGRDPAIAPLSFRTTSAPKPTAPKSAVEVLAILGHSEGINLDEDRVLLAKLAAARVTFLVKPDRKTLHDRLWEREWEIVFFAGHSETRGEEGRIYINPQESLSIDDLHWALKRAVDRGLKLAIFNSCDGLGLVKKLADLQIPKTIVMRDLVPDRVAHQFLKYFLLEFAGEGRSFEAAVCAARQRLQGLEGEFPGATWLPVICEHPAAVSSTWEQWLAPRRDRPPGSAIPRRVAMASAIALAVTASYLGLRSPLSLQLNRLGVEQYRQQDTSAAVFYFQWAIKLDPKNSRALNNLGDFYATIGDIERARSHLSRSSQLGNAWACNHLARLEIRDARYELAETLLRGCLPHMRQTGSRIGEYLLLKNRGWALLEQKKYRQAEQVLLDAIALAPKEGAADCYLALVRASSGRELDAIASWRVCYRYANPAHPDEIELIERAERQLSHLLADSESPTQISSQRN